MTGNILNQNVVNIKFVEGLNLFRSKLVLYLVLLISIFILLLQLLYRVVLDEVNELIAEQYENRDPNVEVVDVFLVVVEHVDHSVSALIKCLGFVIGVFDLRIIFFLWTYKTPLFNNHIHPAHNDLNILSDEWMIFLDH